LKESSHGIGQHYEITVVADETGTNGDEQMPLGAIFFLVEHRAQAEFRFETAEHRLQIGQHHVGAPRGGRVPRGFIAAQAIHPRIG
jgi:hypothetical protein